MSVVRDEQGFEPAKVLLVDDHVLLLDGLTAMIEAEHDIVVVGRAGTRQEAVAHAAEQQPSVAVVDLVIPGGGLRAIREIGQASPATKTIALTVLDDAEHLRAVASQGGSGFLVKRAAARELLDAIRIVHGGGEYWGGRTEPRPRPHEPAAAVVSVELSQRETQVLRLLSHGYTHKEIASRLQISKKSVDTYRLRLQDKVGGRGRADLVRYAIASGLFGESVSL